MSSDMAVYRVSAIELVELPDGIFIYYGKEHILFEGGVGSFGFEQCKKFWRLKVISVSNAKNTTPGRKYRVTIVSETPSIWAECWEFRYMDSVS